MAINKGTQYITNPNSIPVTTETGTDEELSDALNNRATKTEVNNKVSLGDAQWLGLPIGSCAALPLHLPGVEEPPTNDTRFRYVKLTAGEDGVGGYNEGILSGETSTGSGPEQSVTATIDHAPSPLNGDTIHLWNSEGRYPSPGETSGIVANDQMQGHYHNTNYEHGIEGAGGTTNPDGLLQLSNDSSLGFSDNTEIIKSPISDGGNGTPRIGDHTNVKRETRVYYMRIL